MNIFVEEFIIKLILDLKFEFNLIASFNSIFMSPSEIFIPSTFPKIFLIKISFLSAKKLKFVLVRFKPPNSSEFKFLMLPLVIKLSNVPSLSKNISISEKTFPELTLLFKKLLKFEGFINERVYLIQIYLSHSKLN